jgi:hypothetical protein
LPSHPAEKELRCGETNDFSTSNCYITVATCGPGCYCNIEGKHWHRLLQSLTEVTDEWGEMLDLNKINVKDV